MECLHVLGIQSFDCFISIPIYFSIVFGALFGAGVLLKGH
jgi:hypothetical protein